MKIIKNLWGDEAIRDTIYQDINDTLDFIIETFFIVDKNHLIYPNIGRHCFMCPLNIFQQKISHLTWQLFSSEAWVLMKPRNKNFFISLLFIGELRDNIEFAILMTFFSCRHFACCRRSVLPSGTQKIIKQMRLTCTRWRWERKSNNQKLNIFTKVWILLKIESP